MGVKKSLPGWTLLARIMHTMLAADNFLGQMKIATSKIKQKSLASMESNLLIKQVNLFLPFT